MGSTVLLFVLQLAYALAGTLFFIVIPAVLMFPDRLTPKGIVPLWLVVSFMIAVFTTSAPPENPDPRNCRETSQWVICS